MQDKIGGLEAGPDGQGPIEWRNLLQFDAKAVAAIAVCVLMLVGLLWALPTWLRGQERADFAGVPTQTATGVVTICQISPVTSGGGGLFNAVTVEFGKRTAYYALPKSSTWSPKPFGRDKVRVVYRLGRHSGQLRVVSVTPIVETPRETQGVTRG